MEGGTNLRKINIGLPIKQNQWIIFSIKKIQCLMLTDPDSFIS